MRFAFITLSGLSLIASIGLTGCIPQNQYDDLMTAYRSKEQQLLQMQGEYTTARANENMLREQLAQAAADLATAKSLVGGDRGTLDELEARYKALQAQLLTLNPLPESLNTMLLALAEKYPNVFTYDEKRGMLRFTSDFTFDSGSAKLTSSADEVLQQFATILNTSDAQNLEVRVVGHTDNVAIRRTATAAAHPTNMFLSAHRSISVRDALVSDGVNAGRFMVAGYGEFRPIAENSARGNAENRRVEIFLVPMPTVAMAGTSTVAPASTKTAVESEENEK